MDDKLLRRGLVLFRNMLMVCDNEGVLTREERELATEFADEVRRLRTELLAYREGYDPQERLPEVGRIVRVTTTEGYRLAVLTSDRKWRWNCDVHPFESVKRWYPIGGNGER